MPKLNDENYYIIHGWMLNRLGLKGTQLQVFSIVYGFSQDGENEYSGSLSYLCDFTGASKPTIIKALSELSDRGFLIKRQERINGVLFNHYSANLQVVKNFNQGSKETLPTQLKNFTGGSKETLPIPYKENNKEYDKEYDKEDNKGTGKKRFVPPTLEEVTEYARSRNSNVDPKRFWEYFNAGDWTDAKGQPVRSWKQKFITWESKQGENQAVKQERAQKAGSLDDPANWDNYYAKREGSL